MLQFCCLQSVDAGLIDNKLLMCTISVGNEITALQTLVCGANLTYEPTHPLKVDRQRNE